MWNSSAIRQLLFSCNPASHITFSIGKFVNMCFVCISFKSIGVVQNVVHDEVLMKNKTSEGF